MGASGLRLSGRYGIAGPIAVPFRLHGCLRVQNGSRLQLEASRLEVVGAAWPGFTTDFVQNRINKRMPDLLAKGTIPVAIRLTDVAHETGRITLHAECDIELEPRAHPTVDGDPALPDRRTSAEAPSGPVL